MTEDDLLSLIEGEEADCLSTSAGALAEQRREAMQYYYGQPYGNEVEGRSQVVTTEVKDAVEEIMPAMMKIFTSSDEVVRFEPQQQEDQPAAEQATDYVNYIFSRVNNGFRALYCLFKDALLQKNGFLKIYWEEYEDSTKETYQGLSDDEFKLLSQDEDLELVEHAEREVQTLDPYAQMMMPGRVHDVVFRKSRKYGKVCIDPVPPEEVLISRDAANDLTKARFVEHRTKRSISDIRKMGYDVPDDIADFSSNAEHNMERVERLKYDDATAVDEDSGNSDPSSRMVWLCEAHVRVDFDGDGIAELRKITKVGKKILDNEEADSINIVGGTAILMPHKYYGLSIHDLLKDIQLQSTTLLRNLFDNTYLANNGRYEALDGMVNMDDLMTSRPGGVVRVKALGAVKRIDTPVLGQPAYNLLDYLDRVRQRRTGIMDVNDWTDPNVLNAKAGTTNKVGAAAQQRIELMARILAEGPVKDLFWKILELVSKHQDKPKVVKLRGGWVQVDPREWHNKFDMTVTVGLGTGDQSMVVQGAMGIMGVQAQMLSAGLGGVTVGPEQIYLAATKFAKATFPKDGHLFFMDPKTAPPKEPPAPDPKIIAAQIAAQTQERIAAMEANAEAQNQSLKKEFDAAKTQFRAAADKAAQDRDHQLEVMKLMYDQEKENKARVVDAISKIQLTQEQGQNAQQQVVLQGIVDGMLKQQDHQHAQMEQMLKGAQDAAMVEKEIVRDKQTGKATGVRPKK
jgi:hypothetical protein